MLWDIGLFPAEEAANTCKWKLVTEKKMERKKKCELTKTKEDTCVEDGAVPIPLLLLSL